MLTSMESSSPLSMTQSNVSFSKRFLMLRASPSTSTMKTSSTGKGRVIGFVFVFCLHVINHDLGKVHIGNVFVSFLVHVLTQERVPCPQVCYLAAWLHELGNYVSQVRPILVPVKLIQIPDLSTLCTLHISSPRRFASHSDYFFRNTFTIMKLIFLYTPYFIIIMGILIINRHISHCR